MYLGMVYSSCLSFRFNLVENSFTSIFIMYITKFQIIPEEAAMKSIFGEDFNKYKKNKKMDLI